MTDEDTNLTELRVPPRIFDDPTFGLHERFASERIPVADGNRWWAEILGRPVRYARGHAAGLFERTTAGHTWVYLRSSMARTLIDLHGLRLFVWLISSIESERADLAGLVTADAPCDCEEELSIHSLAPIDPADTFESVGVACTIRALDLRCRHAEEMLAISRRYATAETARHCHEWGWTRWLPGGDDHGLVHAGEAIRWWAITENLTMLDAQVELAGALDVANAPGGPVIARDDLIRYTRPHRLSVLSTRAKNAMDYLINGECAATEQDSAPDLLKNSLLEAHALDPGTGDHLIGWTRGYFPHIAAEAEEMIR